MPINDTMELSQIYPQNTLTEHLTFPIIYNQKKFRFITSMSLLHKEHSTQVNLTFQVVKITLLLAS